MGQVFGVALIYIHFPQIDLYLMPYLKNFKFQSFQWTISFYEHGEKSQTDHRESISDDSAWESYICCISVSTMNVNRA